MKEKRIAIVAKEVKMIVREPKYLKKLEGYPKHGVSHGEDVLNVRNYSTVY